MQKLKIKTRKYTKEELERTKIINEIELIAEMPEKEKKEIIRLIKLRLK